MRTATCPVTPNRPLEQPQRLGLLLVCPFLGGLGLVAERVLIDAHVVGVSEVLFDDVVQIDASRRPSVSAVIFMGGRRSNHSRQDSGDNECRD